MRGIIAYWDYSMPNIRSLDVVSSKKLYLNFIQYLNLLRKI